MLAAVPAGRRVMVLMEDGLREFDPDRQSWREIRTAENSRIAPFLEMCPGSADELYITGEHGLAKLHILRDGGAFEWLEVNGGAQRTHALRLPVAGRRASCSRREYPRGQGGTSSYAGREPDSSPCTRRPRTICAAGAAATAASGSSEGAAIFRLRGGRKYPVERTGVLTGNIFDVYSEEGKAFWVATSEGITRYTPPLWRQPRRHGGFRPAGSFDRGRSAGAAMDERHRLRAGT